LVKFISVHGLDGVLQSEVVPLYEEAYPPDRRAARSQCMRARQLALMRRLEGLTAESPQASNLVTDWFGLDLAAKLVNAGMITLGDMNARIAAGGV
jgi:hypothetical protein